MQACKSVKTIRQNDLKYHSSFHSLLSVPPAAAVRISPKKWIAIRNNAKQMIYEHKLCVAICVCSLGTTLAVLILHTIVVVNNYRQKLSLRWLSPNMTPVIR